MQTIFVPENNTIPDTSLIGGKARNLAILSANEIPVPRWMALTVPFFETFMGEKVGRIDSLLSGSVKAGEVASLARQIQEMILNQDFTPVLKEGILNILKNNFENYENQHFAVRSSATDEDSLHFSFAGQLESFLYQKLNDEFFQSIKNCFASAFSERSLSYRITSGISTAKIRPAVIIQQMIFGEVSGVLFTGNPLNNNPDQILLNAVYGIGEGIVSGELDADSWVIDENGKIIKKEIAKKEEWLTFDSEKGYGTIKMTLGNEKQESPSLTEEQVLELGKLAGKIESDIYLGVPQDIEWTLYNGKIYILQSRPITTFAHINKKKARTIYDNSNIVESYSGATTPITFSMVNESFDFAYTHFLNMIHTSKSSMKKLRLPLKNSIGFIKGMLYYNLNTWYRGLQEIPGYNLNRRFMEQMMGVKSSVDIEKEEVSALRKIFVELPKLLRTFALLIYHLKTIKGKVRKFTRNFNKAIGPYLNEDFASFTNEELIELYHYFSDEVAKKYGLPIINDFGTMIYYGMLAKEFKKLGIKDIENLQNDLIAGEGEVESTKPTKEIIRISNRLRQNEKLTQLFKDKNETELMELILESEEEQYSEIRDMIREYIRIYGFRAMNELKFEELTIREDPTFLFTMLKNYLKRDAINLEEMEAREKAVRERAEKTLFEKVGFMKRRKLKKILKKARFHIKKREELRFMRTKYAGVVRSLVYRFGKNFEKSGLIDDFKDICFFTINEIFELIQGRSANRSFVKELVAMRKKDYEDNKNNEPHERMYYYGDIYEDKFVEILSDAELEPEEETGDANTFKGTPCSPGQIEGIAKVVLTAEDASLNGEILVTKRTDPGWVPLFPSISGLVIERGSVLSHSAVVAREMGIPTIVGLRKITERIQTDDRVRVDGSNGLVSRLKK